MGALAKAVLAFHLVKTAGLINNTLAFPVLRSGDRAPARPRTSILVPARDEAHRLSRTLLGLLAQPAEEILVYDDESTDATADTVRAVTDPRVRLLTGPPRPDGWTGKNWACHQLARAAGGELLVFCDADIVLAPGALDAVWAEMRCRRADVFSAFARQHTATFGERLLTPLIDEHLLAFLPHQFLRVPVPPAAAASGGLLAFTRAAYRTIGGHEAVAGEIVEDIALARRARAHGLALGLALGGDLVGIRMYDGYVDSIRGFGKSLRAAHGGSRGALVVTAAGNLTAYTLPWLLLRRGPAWRAAAVLGLAERLIVNAKTGRRAYGEAALVPFTAPAALPVYATAMRRTARWKGRTYR
jgi:glycosyltransferase involved in cell wall biosynthesis